MKISSRPPDPAQDTVERAGLLPPAIESAQAREPIDLQTFLSNYCSAGAR